MIVTGGSYRERCLSPAWDSIMGSGGRGAAAVSDLSPGTVLHTYAHRERASDIEIGMRSLGVEARVTSCETDVTFRYLHPLAAPDVTVLGPPSLEPLSVDGDVVLRFGMVEGEAVVRAGRAVYDPQSRDAPAFHDNGSIADQLAMVLNEAQVLSAAGTGAEASEAADAIVAAGSAAVVVVKAGVRGATVHVAGRRACHVPPYESERVFKIGSGDVFSAVFAHLWGERDMPPAEAADLASRATASYVEDRTLPVPSLEALATRRMVPGREPGRVYIAAPFFDIAQLWLVEELRACLATLGVPCFSPLHDVGTGADACTTATADLLGLRGCGAVLAVLDGGDPGTLFEVGYARALGLPVIALAEAVPHAHLTMISGSGCRVLPDLASAAYAAAFVSLR